MAERKGFEPLRQLPDLPVFKTGPFNQTWVSLQYLWCLRPDLNRHEVWPSQDFKSCASTNSATQANKMVSRTELESVTLWLKVKCSTNWANGTYYNFLAASARFELANATVKVWCLTAWLRGNIPLILNGGGRWIWTIEPEGTDLQSAAFGHFAIPPNKVVPEIGLEPTTYWLQVSCSTNWAIPANKWWAI